MEGIDIFPFSLLSACCGVSTCQYLASVLTHLKNQFTHAQGRRERFREPLKENLKKSHIPQVLRRAAAGGGLRALLEGRGHISVKPCPRPREHPVPEVSLTVSKRPCSSAHGFCRETPCHCTERQRPWWDPYFFLSPT